MSSLNDTSAIFKYHRDMIRDYGAKSSLALGWRDRDSQMIRFEVLAGIADLNGRSVLDVGCGYADLLPFLTECYPHLSTYYGIEQIPELLDEATSRHESIKAASFIAGNFMYSALPKTDVVLACGSLNYTSDDPKFVFKAITKLFDTCKVALGFNLLRTVPYEGLLAVYDPQDILMYCRTLSDDVVMIDDYAEEDFTVFMYRQAIKAKKPHNM